MTSAKWLLRRLIFPGFNLHARLRNKVLPTKFGQAGPDGHQFLDAGSGNGMLSIQAYRRGFDVRAVTFQAKEADKARAYFVGAGGADPEKLRFECGNLYEVDLPANHFDQIVCAEVIEHIRDHERVCRKFYDALKPGGVLHMTSPNAEHPYNIAFPLDLNESGGHVRPGYTPESFAELLEPIGFRIEAIEPMGGPVRQFFNARIKSIQARFGAMAGAPLFLAALPMLAFESRAQERACPFAYYVKAVKPEPGGAAADA